MSVTRTRRNQKLYDDYMAHQLHGCVFCQINEGHSQFVEAAKYFKVISNRFPYAYWDDQTVDDHLMVVPIEHLKSVRSFTPEQANEYIQLIGRYEENGYHVYARAVDSLSRSVVHQHTHLIKGAGKVKHFVLQVDKPHILFVK